MGQTSAKWLDRQLDMFRHEVELIERLSKPKSSRMNAWGHICRIRGWIECAQEFAAFEKCDSAVQMCNHFLFRLGVATADFLKKEKEMEETQAFMHDYGWALKRMREGKRVRRKGWNGKGMWIAIQLPDENSKMRSPYIYMKPVDDNLVPWLCSQSDALAYDWELADG